MSEYDYTYLALGAGVQSSALLVLCLTDPGYPDIDAAIFADTGDEPGWVYGYLEVLTEFAARHGVEVHRAQKGVLSEWMIDRQKAGKRFVPVPIYTASPDGGREGMLRRQCTREFKIEPIEKKVRELLGYKPRQRVKHKVRALMGISIDEAVRMKPSRTKWITNVFPLVDHYVTRERCKRIVMDAGLPEPQKSACVYCPYHSDAYWRWMKEQHPDEFARAVEFDEGVRNMTMRGREQPGYVHRSCVPLAEAYFGEDQIGLFEPDFVNECEGMCGV